MPSIALASRRSLLLLLSLFLLTFSSLPAQAETGTQTPAAQSQTAGESQVTFSSGATATLQATPESVTVMMSTGESFSAPNPYKAAVESKLELLQSKVGEHLVASVIANELIHAWVLMPQDGVLKLGVEISDVQTVKLAGDLVMVGIVTPIADGRTSVASRIYRYSAATGTYEKTAAPVGTGGGGGPAYPIPPGMLNTDEDQHSDEAAAASPAATGGPDQLLSYVLVGVVGLLALALIGLLFWLVNQRKAQAPPVQPTPTTPPADVQRFSAELAALSVEVRRLRSQPTGTSPQTGNAPVVTLTEQELTELAALGLPNPAVGLVHALQERTDLIPFPPSPGGSMQFADVDSWVISHRWIIARFHDGKTGGSILLRYRVSGGSVEWTVLDFERD